MSGRDAIELVMDNPGPCSWYLDGAEIKDVLRLLAAAEVGPLPDRGGPTVSAPQ